MAAPNFTSAERQDIYRNLFLLNRSFHLIVQRLDKLTTYRICNPRYLREMQGFAQEVQLDINTLLVGSLHSDEENDWSHFGKVRLAVEKRIKEPIPKQKSRK